MPSELFVTSKQVNKQLVQAVPILQTGDGGLEMPLGQLMSSSKIGKEDAFIFLAKCFAPKFPGLTILPGELRKPISRRHLKKPLTGCPRPASLQHRTLSSTMWCGLPLELTYHMCICGHPVQPKGRHTGSLQGKRVEYTQR